MNLHTPMLTAAAFLLLSAPALAQADPHHPDAAAPPAAVEEQAPATAPDATQPAASSQTPASTAPSAPAVPALSPAMPMMPMTQMMGHMQMRQMQLMQMMQMMEMMQSMQMMGMQMMQQEMMPDMQMMHQMMQSGSGAPSPGPGAAAPTAPTMEPATDKAAASGADPDLAFVQSMILHHQGAIAMAEGVLQSGDDEEVKAWARGMIADQQAGIAKMQAWLQRHAQ